MMQIDDPVYGPFLVDEVIADLIATESVQRLARIHQAGAAFIPFPRANSTRLEHSLGVVKVVQVLGGGIEEQVASLLHDISHGAFSHVIDYLFEDESETTCGNRESIKDCGPLGLGNRYWFGLYVISCGSRS